MDRLQAMHLFTRIVTLGSFSRAAEQMGLPRASATQMIQRLEARLGVRLLERSTRHVRPTAEGALYHERCLAILADVDEAESALLPAAHDPSGRIRVNLPGSLARLVLVPALPAFCARYPRLTLEVRVNNRQIDLVREGVDCVLRIGITQDESLAARPLGQLAQHTCASPAYLARQGTPRTLDDLRAQAHRMVDYLSPRSGKPTPLEFRTGSGASATTETHQLPASVALDNGDAYIAACEAGFGLIQAPAYHVRAQLAAGTLVEVLPQQPPPALPLSALYPDNRRLPLRVRVFIDWLVQWLPASTQGNAATSAGAA